VLKSLRGFRISLGQLFLLTTAVSVAAASGTMFSAPGNDDLIVLTSRFICLAVVLTAFSTAMADHKRRQTLLAFVGGTIIFRVLEDGRRGMLMPAIETVLRERWDHITPGQFQNFQDLVVLWASVFVGILCASITRSIRRQSNL
jgi:hypothetical protein